MIKRIYIDTSVFGGYFDKEFEKETVPFFERISEKRIKIIVSEILELELYRTPAYIQDFFESIPIDLVERVELTDEIRELAEKYILEKVVGKASRVDCQHIALATVNKADVLASWNFKHIVNLERIRGYNSVNFKNFDIKEISAQQLNITAIALYKDWNTQIAMPVMWTIDTTASIKTTTIGKYILNFYNSSLLFKSDTVQVN